MDQKRKFRELLFCMEMARKAALHPVWGELGLIAGQPRVLSHLLEQDQVTQRELSDRCAIDPATLSRLLDKLEAAGYILRDDNPECRRSFLISLTESGREMAGKVREEFTKIETKMLQGFSSGEIEELIGKMERIFKNLKSQSDQ